MLTQITKFPVIFVLLAVAACQGPAPRHAEFPAEVRDLPFDAAVELPPAPPYARDELARALSEPPNFAGTARLVTWGCGTGCVTGLIADAATGAVAGFGFAIHRDIADPAPSLDYRPDSRLLVARGWLDEEEHGVFYFEWTGHGLERVAHTPGRPE